jgi:hypothetical protein
VQDYSLVPNGHDLCPTCAGTDEDSPNHESARECRVVLEYHVSEIRKYKDDEGRDPSEWPKKIERRLAKIEQNAKSAGPYSKYHEVIYRLYEAELGNGQAEVLYLSHVKDREQKAAANNAREGSGMAALIRRARDRLGQGRR